MQQADETRGARLIGFACHDEAGWAEIVMRTGMIRRAGMIRCTGMIGWAGVIGRAGMIGRAAAVTLLCNGG